MVICSFLFLAGERIVGFIIIILAIGLTSRVFANCQGDEGSISGRVIPKTQKWYLMPPCLTFSIKRYGSRVNWSNPGNGVTPSLNPLCSCYWKGRLRVALDNGRQLYLLLHISAMWNANWYFQVLNLGHRIHYKKSTSWKWLHYFSS